MNSIKNVINNRLVDCDIRYNEPMSKHTSFGIGGCASCLVFPKTISQVTYLLRSLNKTDLKYYIIGSGTNMLISDSGYNGVIISLKKTFKSIDIDNDIITVESGVMLGAGVIVVLHERSKVIEVVKHLASYNANETCGKCTPCRE